MSNFNILDENNVEHFMEDPQMISFEVVRLDKYISVRGLFVSGVKEIYVKKLMSIEKFNNRTYEDIKDHLINLSKMNYE